MSIIAAIYAMLAKIIGFFLRQRWVRFGIVGVAATACYFLLGLLFVYALGLPVLAGNTLAYALSFFVSYFGQTLWTFHAEGSHRAMLPKFAATQLTGLALNSLIVELVMRMGAKYEWAMLMASAAVPVFVYVICKIWVYGGDRKKSCGNGAKR